MHQSGYHADYEHIRDELIKIGNAYLRGQALLGLAVGVMTGVLLGLLGVRNALALGVVSGLLEMVPYFGPLISAVIAVLVAFFQPENYLGLSQVQFALATLAVMILVQQIENNFLVPRIVGGALDLKPLTVIIAVVVGFGLAGIWGGILAAPIAAAIKLLGGYMWRKLLGLPPFPPEDAHEMRGPSLLGRTLGRVRRRGKGAGVEVEEDVGPPGEPPSAAKA
jgi:predicted PurR-regulated permease PerM